MLSTGEFGLATAVVDASQGELWLGAVRAAAAHAGFVGHCAWTYFGTKNGLVAEADGHMARERLCSWDHSRLAAAALGLDPEAALAREDSIACAAMAMAPPRAPSPSAPDASHAAGRPCPADGDARPQWADVFLLPASEESSEGGLSAGSVAVGSLLAVGGLGGAAMLVWFASRIVLPSPRGQRAWRIFGPDDGL